MYISEIVKILPKKYNAQYIANKLYPSEIYGKKINTLAIKLSKKVGIEFRTCVFDCNAYPKIKLANRKDHPINWGKDVINSLTKKVCKNEIGFFSLIV